MVRLERNTDGTLDHALLGALVHRLETPLAVYDAEALIERFYEFVEAFAECRAMACFASAAAPNTQVLHRLVKRGAGLRVGSAADLERAWLCGAPLSRVVYTGLGKTDNDIRAALDGLYSPLFQAGRLVEGKPPYYRGPVGWFGVESGNEIEQLARLAGGVRIACRVMVRVALPMCASPVPGASPDEVVDLFYRYGSDPRLRLNGLRIHLGRAGVSIASFAEAAMAMCELARRLSDMGAPVTAIDLGGGFACDAWNPDAPSPADYAQAIMPAVMPCVEEGMKIIIEPGWSIAAAGSVLVSRVLAVREVNTQSIVIADAVPTEPAELNQLVPERILSPNADLTNASDGCVICDVNRPERCVQSSTRFNLNELIAWRGGGAYVARNEHAASEVLVENDRAFVIRARAMVSELVGPETDSHEVLL